MDIKMEEIINKIKAEIDRYDQVYNPGATSEQISKVNDKMGELYKVKIPGDYERFLMLTNGIEFNGEILYGIGLSHDLLKMNEIHREGTDIPEKIILIGENDLSVFSYDKNRDVYSAHDRMNFNRKEDYAGFINLLDEMAQRALN
jgi:hypothetical protein